MQIENVCGQGPVWALGRWEKVVNSEDIRSAGEQGGSRLFLWKWQNTIMPKQRVPKKNQNAKTPKFWNAKLQDQELGAAAGNASLQSGERQGRCKQSKATQGYACSPAACSQSVFKQLEPVWYDVCIRSSDSDDLVMVTAALSCKQSLQSYCS